MKKSIIISCAGMGTRLGIGTTKALIDINGKPLIIHQLENLPKDLDVRIVVGYQAERVMEVVKAYRKDVTFVFNHEYKTTGTGASFSKGLVGANEVVIALDGDLLVHPDDLRTFLSLDYDCIGGCDPTTDNPVLMTIDENENVVEFSRERGSLEWTGLVQIGQAKLTPGTGHVYQMLEPVLPIRVMKIRTKEVDTPNDYENALAWVRNGYQD